VHKIPFLEFSPLPDGSRVWRRRVASLRLKGNLNELFAIGRGIVTLI
jgi:hypothetical protein